MDFEGVIESVRYYNEENNYSVFDFVSDADGDLLTCTAYIFKPLEGERLSLSGDFVNHPNYGRQLAVSRYEKLLPNDEASIERYLASGVIKGVGAKLAQRIVKHFGAETLKVLENAPEKLSFIKGIPMEKALSIGIIFREQTELRRAVMFLQDFGLSPATALKIYNRHKDNTLNVIKTNPYCLVEDVKGIGFRKADEMAAKAGIDKSSPFRIRAGLRHVLSLAVGKGHVFVPKDELFQECMVLLGVSLELIEDSFLQLQFEKAIIQDNGSGGCYIYLSSMYHAEGYVAKKLMELSKSVIKQEPKDIDEGIRRYERKSGHSLADEQILAVQTAVCEGVTVITGGPGTGKTTVIKAIISILKDDKTELAAPTGRAAKRMTEATGVTAKTIHRLLECGYRPDDTNQSFERNQDNPIDAQVIIIDEMSMVDLFLMSSLLKAVAVGTKLILVGDVDQLPSVGAGNVLKDIIQSGCIKTVRLTEIFRQARESAIVMNAHRINNGHYPVLNEQKSDFYFMKRQNPDELCDTLVKLVTERLPGFMNCDALRDIQVLSPMKKSPLGVWHLNQILQKHLNPPNKSKNEKTYGQTLFREGDKVMQNKNNYTSGVYNGDEGLITRIDDANETLTVCFDDSKLVSYPYSQLDELDLSYAITIHKSQGSEYKVVVMPLHSGPPMLFCRNLLYTGVTRARELAVIVGLPETLMRMVDNNREDRRYSRLCDRLISFQELYGNG